MVMLMVMRVVVVMESNKIDTESHQQARPLVDEIVCDVFDSQSFVKASEAR